eukprot:TRINITY_DN9893_c0_g1_i1.p1 TRINITY_DN9893_c0_g1~~TRINITY_DN9893_c0_g1_i1.p1  ORF type:complete len:304 (+),score=61.16 TRINITY_DN9893_c0_g1_i1:110-1021(+)
MRRTITSLKSGPGWRKVKATPFDDSLFMPSDVKEPAELSKTHTVLGVASSLGASPLAIRQLEKKTEVFYQWARNEFWVLWATRALLAYLLIQLYWLSDLYNLYAMVQRRDEVTDHLVAMADREQESSRAAREAARKMVTDFAVAHGIISGPNGKCRSKPITDEALEQLRHSIEQLLRPRSLSLSEFWTEKLRAIEDARHAAKRAYERHQGITGEHFLSSRVVIEGSKNQEHSTVTNTELGQIPVPAAKQREYDKFISDARENRKAQESISNSWLEWWKGAKSTDADDATKLPADPPAPTPSES